MERKESQKKYQKVGGFIATLLLLVGLSFPVIKSPISVQAALTPPSGYDYSIYYNSTEGGFVAQVVGESASLIPFTCSVDGSYYNYTTPVMVATGFPNVQLTFNRSTTSWTPNGAYYNATSSTIGSNNTVGTLGNKIIISFNNNTNHDFMFTFDRSSSANALPSYWRNSSLNWGGQYEAITLGYATIGENRFYIPAYSTWELRLGTVSTQQYMDAIYLNDLGVSTAYTEGYENGVFDYYIGDPNNPQLNNYPYSESYPWEQGFNSGMEFWGMLDVYDLDGDNDTTEYIQGGDAFQYGQSRPETSVLLNALSTIGGLFFAVLYMILTIEIYDISIMGILIVLGAIVLPIWILKLIRG